MGPQLATSSSPTAPASTSTSARHPEYATPECDSIYDLVVHDKAGERILEQLLGSAEQRLREEGIRGVIYLFKNNTDSAGNSYGCHENYLTSRRDDFGHYAEVLIPFLVSRQIYAGAGKVLQTARGAMYCISPAGRAHLGGRVVSATTRSRPIINTRDEPHADAERYRRLHVIVGDSNMSEYATFLKVGATSILLRMLEDPSVVLRDMTLENPIRAIREISHDITCRRRVRLANGREASRPRHPERVPQPGAALRRDHGPHRRSRSRRSRCGSTASPAIENDPLDARPRVRLGHQAQAHRGATATKHDLPLTHPKVALIDLQYHDVNRDARPLLQHAGRAAWSSASCTDADIDDAVETPPQTTRARLRGEFIRRAKERKRDYTVDWVHLKLNDQAQRTVLCKDPFKSHDERVEKLIASLCSAVPTLPHRHGHRAPRGARRAAAGRTTDRRPRPTSLTQLTGTGRGGRPGRAQHHRGRARARHRRLARRPLEPGPRRAGRARARPHHEAALHEPPGRHRRRRGARTPTSPTDLGGMPVVVVQRPQPGAGGGRGDHAPPRPTARIAYVMTDGAALPLALSDLVADLRDAGLIDGTVTAGHAFGGDLEAVTVPSALALARHVGRRRRRRSSAWAPAWSAPAPPLGTTALEVAGDPRRRRRARRPRRSPCCACPTATRATRHQGVSHHTRTALDLDARPSVLVAAARRRAPSPHARHDVRVVDGARRRRAARRRRPARHHHGPRPRRGPALLRAPPARRRRAGRPTPRS